MEVRLINPTSYIAMMFGRLAGKNEALTIYIENFVFNGDFFSKANTAL